MLRIFLAVTVNVATCEQGWPQADATDAAALGPTPLGVPRHGVWVDYIHFSRCTLRLRIQ